VGVWVCGCVGVACKKKLHSKKVGPLKCHPPPLKCHPKCLEIVVTSSLFLIGYSLLDDTNRSPEDWKTEDRLVGVTGMMPRGGG
jgi:hypothetical protein